MAQMKTIRTIRWSEKGGLLCEVVYGIVFQIMIVSRYILSCRPRILFADGASPGPKGKTVLMTACVEDSRTQIIVFLHLGEKRGETPAQRGQSFGHLSLEVDLRQEVVPLSNGLYSYLSRQNRKVSTQRFQ
jgi:hypothetical protein